MLSPRRKRSRTSLLNEHHHNRDNSPTRSNTSMTASAAIPGAGSSTAEMTVTAINASNTSSIRKPILTYNSPTRASLSKHNAHLLPPKRYSMSPLKRRPQDQSPYSKTALRPPPPDITPDTEVGAFSQGDAENPFGNRYNVVGGERYPGLKNKPALVIDDNPYSPRSRLTKPIQNSSPAIRTPIRQSQEEHRDQSELRTDKGNKGAVPFQTNNAANRMTPKHINRHVSRDLLGQRGRKRASEEAYNQIRSENRSFRIPHNENEPHHTPQGSLMLSRVSAMSLGAQDRQADISANSGKDKSRQRLLERGNSVLVKSPRDIKAPLQPISLNLTQSIRLSAAVPTKKELLKAQIKALELEIANIDEERKLEEQIRSDRLQFDSSQDVSLNEFLSKLLHKNESLQQIKSKSTSYFSIAEEPSSLPSLSPIMTANPLLQLGAFSSLSFNGSDVNFVLTNKALKIHHKYVFSGYSHEKLLCFNIEMHVQPEVGPWVSDLSIKISTWAEPELGRFLNKMSKQNSITACLYSIDSYCSLAKKRAQCWSRMRSKYSDLKAEPNTPANRTAISKTGVSLSGEQCKRNNMIKYLSQQQYKFRRKSNSEQYNDVQLLVVWDIVIDLAGNARSSLDARLLTPYFWTDNEDHGHEKVIGDMLRSLIEQKGVDDGIYALVDTIFRRK